jgi:hypothetical protein
MQPSPDNLRMHSIMIRSFPRNHWVYSPRGMFDTVLIKLLSIKYIHIHFGFLLSFRINLDIQMLILYN